MISAMHEPLRVANAAIRSALTDAGKARSLDSDPARYFRESGIDIPPELDGEFNQMFRETQPRLLQHARLHAEAGQFSDEALVQLEVLAFPSFACAACSVGAFSIAAVIVALGAAGLAALTPEAAVVVALAAFAGVSAEVALAFIATLGTVVAGGVAAVVKAICGWTGAC